MTTDLLLSAFLSSAGSKETLKGLRVRPSLLLGRRSSLRSSCGSRTDPKDKGAGGGGGGGGIPSSVGSGGGSSVGGGGGGGEGGGGGGESGGGGGGGGCAAKGRGGKDAMWCPLSRRSLVSLSTSATTFACRKDRGADGGSLFIIAAGSGRGGGTGGFPTANEATP